MPRIPTIWGTSSAMAPPISQKPDARNQKLTTAQQRANRDAVKLPTPGGEYRARGVKKSNAKAATGKTRQWRGK